MTVSSNKFIVDLWLVVMTSTKLQYHFTFFPSLPGIHPTTISESFQKAADKAVEVLTEMAVPVTLADRESLLKSATTSLNSKVCRLTR